MRIRLVSSALLVAMIAACGGGAAPTANPSTGEAPPASTAASAPAADGTVDCAAIRTAAQQLL